MSAELTGKAALVTGGGQGIGRAIALALAERGADVAISGRTESKLTAVAAEIEALGVRTAISVGDVAVRADAQAMVATAAASFGGLDILINNAQATKPGVKVADLDDDDVGAVLRKWAARHAVVHAGGAAGDDRARRWQHRQLRLVDGDHR